MAFRFTLDAILRLRRNQEHAEELRLAAIHAAIARLRNTLTKIDQQIRDLRSATNDHVAQQISGAELRFFVQCGERIEELKIVVMRELEDLDVKRREQRDRLNAAHAATEAMVTLFDQQAAEYAKARARSEQSQIDDRTLQHRMRKSKA